MGDRAGHRAGAARRPARTSGRGEVGSDAHGAASRCHGENRLKSPGGGALHVSVTMLEDIQVNALDGRVYGTWIVSPHNCLKS